MGIKYDVNESFFDEWSDEMAYVLGFMFADGHLGDYEYFRGKYINFSNTDLNRIELIKNLLEAEHEITDRHIKDSEKILYTLRIGSHVLFNRLYELGVTPRKSLTMQFPSVPAEYLGSFVLGYFDGDGCVSLEPTTNSYRGLITVFTCASYSFLEILRKRLENEHGLTPRKIVHHGSSKSTYQLRYSTRNSLRLYQLMYGTKKLITLGLPRKYDIFIKYLQARNLTDADIPLILGTKGPVAK